MMSKLSRFLLLFSSILVSQPLISISMRRVLTKLSSSSSSTYLLHSNSFRTICNLNGSGRKSDSLEVFVGRHAYKYKHVCAATTAEPSHSEQMDMDNLASEIKSLGDTIRNMKKQMKDSNGSDIDVDKSILEANIASLLEMKGRYASMNEVVNASLNEAIENNEGMKIIPRELKRVDISKLSIRPSLDDVERISKGQAAKRRGTGSRAVPHRLNEMERKEWYFPRVLMPIPFSSHEFHSNFQGSCQKT